MCTSQLPPTSKQPMPKLVIKHTKGLKHALQMMFMVGSHRGCQKFAAEELLRRLGVGVFEHMANEIHSMQHRRDTSFTRLGSSVALQLA